MDKIYLIEKLRFYPWENYIRAACVYEPHGFVETKKEAEKIVKEGGYAKKRLWYIELMKNYRYKKIKRL